MIFLIPTCAWNKCYTCKKAPKARKTYKADGTFHNNLYGAQMNLSEIIYKANQGNPDAMFSLFETYLEGRQIATNYDKAYTYLQQAAARHYVPAERQLGLFYRSGVLVPQNMEKAFYWLSRAARNDSQSQYFLGNMYLTGEGVPKNYYKALKLYEKAAGCGYAEAQDTLAAIYYWGYIVEQDLAKALYWHEQAAAQGLASSQYCLACMYFKGIGIVLNHEKAFELCRLAAIQGYKDAEYMLGQMYIYGLGVVQDVAEGIRWSQKSARI